MTKFSCVSFCLPVCIESNAWAVPTVVTVLINMGIFFKYKFQTEYLIMIIFILMAVLHQCYEYVFLC